MTIDKENYTIFLEQVANSIDIPPRKYQDAVDRYQAVGQWLEGGYYPGSVGIPRIYPQGSFRLGTVVRPICGGIEASYDIDLVSELQIEKQHTDPGSIKGLTGQRLKEHGTYNRLIDEEGKRCWTLEYAEQDGIGFHLDVLPSVPDNRTALDASIAITNKQDAVYNWSASDPIGYGDWFDSKNQAAFNRIYLEQKTHILAGAPDKFARIDDVPDQLVRTPLQRSIQLMKRHRDMQFNNRAKNGHAPISIIITTLAAEFYQDELDLYSAITGIIARLHAHAVLVDNGVLDNSLSPRSPIKRTPDGKWYIGNPANPEENFADRWHEDNHARAKAFFAWVGTLREDLINLLTESSPDTIKARLCSAFGTAAVSSHLNLLIPSVTAPSSPPRIHISEAPKPWKA